MVLSCGKNVRVGVLYFALHFFCFVNHGLLSGSFDIVFGWFQLVVHHASYQLGCFILMCVRHKRPMNGV